MEEEFKFYIKPILGNNGIHVYLRSVALYTRCSKCGRELQVTFGSIYDKENEEIDLDTPITCYPSCQSEFGDKWSVIKWHWLNHTQAAIRKSAYTMIIP